MGKEQKVINLPKHKTATSGFTKNISSHRQIPLEKQNIHLAIFDEDKKVSVDDQWCPPSTYKFQTIIFCSPVVWTIPDNGKGHGRRKRKGLCLVRMLITHMCAALHTEERQRRGELICFAPLPWFGVWRRHWAMDDRSCLLAMYMSGAVEQCLHQSP